MLKIVHVSDTHLRDFNPEPGDILIHSGDALNYGNLAELGKFRNQLATLYKNYKHIVYTPGNHDWPLQKDFNNSVDFLKETIPNIHVLHNDFIELEGLKFYGTSDQPWFCNWAFNLLPDELLKSYNNIPDDVEVLVTHCPSKGIRDIVHGKSVGSPELTVQYPRLKKLKLHCFGHIHFSRGLSNINDIWYSNGAMVDEQYQPGHKENVIELDFPRI